MGGALAEAKPQAKKSTFDLRRAPDGNIRIFLNRIDDLPKEAPFSGIVAVPRTDKPLTNIEFIRALAATMPYGVSDFCKEMRTAGYNDAGIQSYLNMVEAGITTHRTGVEGSKTMPKALKFRDEPASVPGKKELEPWESVIVDTVVDWVKFFRTGHYPDAIYLDFAGRAGA
jgi:hypothetical protein